MFWSVVLDLFFSNLFISLRIVLNVINSPILKVKRIGLFTILEYLKNYHHFRVSTKLFIKSNNFKQITILLIINNAYIVINFELKIHYIMFNSHYMQVFIN